MKSLLTITLMNVSFAYQLYIRFDYGQYTYWSLIWCFGHCLILWWVNWWKCWRQVVSELEPSAIQEAESDDGSSATRFLVMLLRPVDISPPETGKIDVRVSRFSFTFSKPLIMIWSRSPKLKIGNLINSTMVQLYQLDFWVVNHRNDSWIR